MSVKRKSFYDDSTLEYQLKFYHTLSEKQKRYFLAYEYFKLGRGSQRYLSQAFGCARQVIVDGIKEIQTPDFVADYTRERRKGGGRKKKSVPYQN